MNFLKRFWNSFGKLFGTKVTAPVVPKSLGEEALLTRFLRHSSHFKILKNEVRSSAFMPPADLRLSVFHITGIFEIEIWKLGEGIVASPDAELHARGDIEVKAVISIPKCGLQIELDNDPPRHAAICGWPQEKSKQKEIALQLAKLASLKLKPS
jgi:hypothetical protein